MVTLTSKIIETIKIMALNIVPTGLSLKKEFFDTLEINNLCHIVFAHLVGSKGSEAVLIEATENNAIKVAPSGSGFTDLDTDAGTAKASFDGTLDLSIPDGADRWDFLIELNDVNFRFMLKDGTFTNPIPLLAGNASIDFHAIGVEVEQRSAANATYHVTGWF